jgi:membrane-associated HD superfamily phosphohydrolase
MNIFIGPFINLYLFYNLKLTNLFGLFGGNHISYFNSFLFLDYKTWGYIFIALICAACIYLTINSPKHSIYLLSAFCICALFTLGVSMHERYILPLIPLMLIGYIYDNDNKYVYIAVIYTILSWFNQAMILFHLFFQNIVVFKVASFFSVVMFVCVLIFTCLKIMQYKNKNNKKAVLE